MIALDTFAALTSNAKVGVAQVVGFVAYFAPYFAIAFAARMATGIIGQLAGVVNDRHRGLFDRTKNIRGKAMQQNMASMTAGTRFNNGALNRITARATTRNLGLGRQGRAAYKNKMELQAEHFAQTDGAKATKWEDNINRAATYSSASEAQRRLGADFGITDPNEIREAIAGVRASGGFGEARRRQAIQALIGSKTGFDNIQQAYQTAARVGSNLNEIEALGSAIHAGSAANGRHDLAPGAGAAARIARQVAQNQPVDWQAATMDALEGVDMVSFLRDKPTQTVQYVTQALNNQLQSDSAILNAPAGSFTPAAYAAAQNRFVANAGMMEQMEQAKTYAAPIAQRHVNTMLDSTATVRNQGLDAMLGITYDGAGNRTDIMRDNRAQVADPYWTGVGPAPAVNNPNYGQAMRDASGAPVPVSTVTQDQINMRRRYEQSRAPRPNPNDPRLGL